MSNKISQIHLNQHMILIKLGDEIKTEESKIKLTPGAKAQVMTAKAKKETRYVSGLEIVKTHPDSQFCAGDRLLLKPHTYENGYPGMAIDGTEYGIIEEFAVAAVYRPSTEERNEMEIGKLAITPAQA